MFPFIITLSPLLLLLHLSPHPHPPDCELLEDRSCSLSIFISPVHRTGPGIKCVFRNFKFHPIRVIVITDICELISTILFCVFFWSIFNIGQRNVLEHQRYEKEHRKAQSVKMWENQIPWTFAERLVCAMTGTLPVQGSTLHTWSSVTQQPCKVLCCEWHKWQWC